MSRAGIYVDNLTREATYQSFKLNPLPPMPVIEMDDAELFIRRQWYDIDNQSNMDW